MSIANGLSLPNPLSNGTTADAVPVMADFNYLLTALNRALLDTGGGSGMNAQNTQIHNLAAGTSANDAVSLTQLGAYALLTGAAFTGAVSFAAATTMAALTTSGLITGNAGFSGSTLGLSGAATLAAITGTTLSLSSTLGVTGASTVAALTASGLITGNAGFSGTTASLSSTLSVSGASTVAALTASGLITGNAGVSTTTLTASGLATLNGGITSNGALTLTGALTPGSAANSVGYLGTPPNAQTGNYTLVLGDIAKTIDMNGANLTLTIPANASVAFPVGTVIVGTNLNATSLTIAITTDTLTWSGTTTTGSRTIGQNGEFRLKKVTATSWLISGTALS